MILISNFVKNHVQTLSCFFLDVEPHRIETSCLAFGYGMGNEKDMNTPHTAHSKSCRSVWLHSTVCARFALKQAHYGRRHCHLSIGSSNVRAVLFKLHSRSCSSVQQRASCRPSSLASPCASARARAAQKTSCGGRSPKC